MQKLSIVVLTHNDELRIVDCLERLKFSDELLILDDESTDRTIELCKQFTKKVFERPLKSNFANQRNYALNLVRNKWVLFIDSDEYVTTKLEKEILKAIEEENINGYFLKRDDYMWGKKIKFGESGSIKILRLAKKTSGKWHGRVHEVWDINGQTEILNEPLIHIPHPSVVEFISEVDYYSSLRASELFENGTTSSAFKIIAYPTLKFFQNYFLRRGYKDKIPGFLYAVIMSFHSFLVRAKLYQIQKSQK